MARKLKETASSRPSGEAPVPDRGTPQHDELTRLRRIEGQVRGIQRMIQEERYCVDLLTQLRSVQSALQRVNDSILERHLRHCVVDAARSGSEELREARIREVMTVLERGR
jgi:DNA-binding FrmR family transcriptional regulator